MNWNWKSVDPGRAARAKSVKLMNVTISESVCSAECKGSTGAVYFFDLSSCTCADFSIQHGAAPCKHILRLAMEAGIIDAKGQTPEQAAAARLAELRRRIAEAAGFYHVFHAPIMTDAEYDALKAGYNDELQKKG